MVGLSFPLLVLAIGGITLWLAWRWEGANLWLIAGGAVMLLGALACLNVMLAMAKPRLSYDSGELVVNLDRVVTRVPLEFVEGVFLGESEADERVVGDQPAKAKNLVVRLSQREHPWKKIKVKAALGAWEHGYITLFGVWCEPLSVDVANRINQQLADAKQQPKLDAEENK